MKVEIIELKNNNKMKQKKLSELFAEKDEKETITDNINDEIEKLKMCVKRFKQENIELRSKIETLQSRKCVICYCIFLSDSDLRLNLTRLDRQKPSERRAAPPATSLLVLEMSIRILLRIWSVGSSGSRYLNCKLQASPAGGLS